MTCHLHNFINKFHSLSLDDFVWLKFLIKLSRSFVWDSAGFSHQLNPWNSNANLQRLHFCIVTLLWGWLLSLWWSGRRELRALWHWGDGRWKIRLHDSMYSWQLDVWKQVLLLQPSKNSNCLSGQSSRQILGIANSVALFSLLYHPAIGQKVIMRNKFILSTGNEHVRGSCKIFYIWYCF